MTPHAFANERLQRFTIGARPRTSDNLLRGFLLEAAGWSIYGLSAVPLLICFLASVGSAIACGLVRPGTHHDATGVIRPDARLTRPAYRTQS